MQVIEARETSVPSILCKSFFIKKKKKMYWRLSCINIERLRKREKKQI